MQTQYLIVTPCSFYSGYKLHKFLFSIYNVLYTVRLYKWFSVKMLLLTSTKGKKYITMKNDILTVFLQDLTNNHFFKKV